MTVLEQGKVYLGSSPQPRGRSREYVQLPFANRHGLITGATGTGKTVSLQIMAEGFSERRRAGLLRRRQGRRRRPRRCRASRRTSSPSAPRRSASPPNTSSRRFPSSSGTSSARRATRSAPPSPRSGRCFCRASSISTTPRRACSTSPSSVADDEGLLLLDLKDLQALLTYVAERASDLTTRYGNVSKATVGTVQRQLLVLEQQGARQLLRRAGARHQRS